MAEKLEGMSIGLNLDTIKLDTGLKNLKSSMKQMNSEMKRNLSVFDYGDKSIKKYNIQLDGLNKKLELQKKVTESARKNYEEMTKQHGEGSKESQKAATAYNNEAAQLNNLERHIGKVSDEMKEFQKQQKIANSGWTKTGDKMINVGNKITNTGDKVQGFGKKWTKTTGIMVGAAVGLGASMFALTTKITEQGDEIAKNSTKMGVSTDFYQEMDYWAGQNGLSHENMEKSMKRLNQRIGEAKNGNEKYTKALTRLNVDMDALQDGTLTTEDAMAQSISTLSEMSSESDKSALASELFGKKLGQELMPALQDGSLSMEEARKKAEELGIVISEDQLKASEDFQDSYDDIKRSVMAVTQQFGLSLMPTLQKGMDWIVGNVPKMREKFDETFSSVKDNIRNVVDWFKLLSPEVKKAIGVTTGIAVALGPVSLAIGTLMKIFGPLVTTFGSALKVVGKFGGLLPMLKGAFLALTGPVGLTVGAISLLVGAFTLAYTKSETFRNIIKGVGATIKNTFLNMMEWVQPGIDAIFSFVDMVKLKVGLFMSQDGEQLKEAFKNIGLFIGTVAMGIWDVIKLAFNGIKSIIEFVMPFIKGIIKSVWKSIEVIISGTLDIIMGVIKVFSGLFTGDFRKMWEGVKQIFKGAIGIVWGLIKNSFVGRIIGSIIEFVSNFKNKISDMWQSVKTNFNNKISEIKTSISDSFVGSIVKSAGTLKTKFVGIISDMLKDTKDRFNKIVDAAKALPGRIGKGISGAKDKAADGMKKVGNKVIEWSGKPFNKVVDGVNWVTKKLGVKGNGISHWSYPQYAKGTPNGGHKGGLAMIGEKGRELVKLPNGKSFVSPNSHTMLDLPKGSHVVPNRPTEEILKSNVPHFAKGTKGWFQSMKDGIGDVWDYVRHPSKIVSKIMDKISLKSGMAQIPKAIVGGAFNFIKTKPIDYIKNMFKKADGDGKKGKPAFGWTITSPYGYRTHPITGGRKLHGGTDYGAPMGSPVPSTTGGKVSFAGWNSGGFGNLVKVKNGAWEMFYAHLSKILVSAGQSISKGTILGKVGSTGASTGPHLHYETRKNGVRHNPMKGFATGGVIKSKMMAMLGEEGEEIVIPTAKNRRTDAMKLLALAANKIGADKGSYERPGNVRGSSGNDELLKATLEQNAMMKEQNDIMKQILFKDTNTYLDGRQVSKGIEGHITNIQNEKRLRRSRSQGWS